MIPPSSDPGSPKELVYACPSCDRPIAIDARAAGLEIACPYCDAPSTVPSAEEADPPLVEEKPKPAPPVEPKATGSGGLPAKRQPGEAPKREVPDAPPGPPPTSGPPLPPPVSAPAGPTGPVQGPGDAILAGLAKGEIEVLPARKVGRKIVFGCPFCSRPIEIKPKAQGKEMDCPECSGRLVAPDLDAGGEALALSGTGGKAGGGVTLPGQKPAGGSPPPPQAPAVVQGTGALPAPPEEEDQTGPVAGDPDSMSAHRLNADKIAKMVPRDEAEAGFHMEDAWASYPDASAAKHAWSNRLKPLLVMGMLGLIAAGIAAGVILMKQQGAQEIEGAGEMVTDTVVAEPAEAVAVADSPAQVVIKTFEGFVAADTVSARLPFVRNPSEVDDAMRLYYGRTRDIPPFPPLDASTYVEKEIRGVRLGRINSIVAEGETLRVFFFEILPDGGALLDWGSAVGYGDVSMNTFSLSPPTRAVEMRVLVKRSNYYNNEFADAAGLASYEITDLGRTAVVYGYAIRGGAVDTTLSSLLPEGMAGWRNCILSLAPHESWEKRNPPQLRIEGMVANGWLKL